ncbi:MAG: histidine phosphatase family protein [Sphingomonadales bacterium]|nr:histidine phosphatase family protein [Sphingomonadales bacterium]
MTATILLIRHAAHAQLGTILSGRTPGISLDEQGRMQATRLARLLDPLPIDLIQSSPVQRARETAEAIAAMEPRLTVEIVAALDELDFGDWAGRAFVELADDPQWHDWNRERASTTCPNGESMTAAQHRAWKHVRRVGVDHPGAMIAMVSHCDIIRAIVAQVMGMTLDNIHRFDIGPASLTRLVVGHWGAKLLSLNEGGHE